MILDKATIKALKKNNRKAQTALYEMSFGILMNVARRYKNNPNDAAILVNEGFIKVLRNINHIDHTESIEPWLKTIMINTAIDDFRRNKKYENMLSMSNFYIEEIVAPAFYENIEFESADYVQSLLDLLPRASANVFNLFALDGYSHKEISELLGISVDTSKWHVKKARKKLIELYQIESERKKVE